MVAKTTAEAKANFEAAIPYIPARYEAGIDKADWFTPAQSDEAESNFADQMSKVIAEKRRQKGIRKRDNVFWQTRAKEKGSPVIGDRIRAALDTWEAEWGPMYDKILALLPRLPPKTIDWRANITNRLVRVVEEWRKAAGKPV